MDLNKLGFPFMNPKIQANLRPADGSEAERIDVLRLKERGRLSRIVVLRNNEDYAQCLASTSAR